MLKTAPKSSNTHVLYGLLIIIVFVTGVAIWAQSLPFHRATIAPAVVIPSGNTRPIQHERGGRVAEVRVTDGDMVQAGTPLLVFDSNEMQIQHETAICQYLNLQTEIARLQAQLQKRDTFSLPDAVLDRLHARKEGHFLDLQQQMLTLNHEKMRHADQLAEQQITQAEASIASITMEKQMLGKRVELARADVNRIEPVAKRGVVSQRSFLELVSRHARLQGELAEVSGRLSSAQQRRFDIQSARQERWLTYLANTTRDLQAAQLRSANLKASIETLALKIERSVLRAPISGRVHGFTITEPGRTLKTGDVIAHIVPSDMPFQIRAQIHPDHVEKIQIGNTAKIRLTAFNPRRQTPLSGTVSRIAHSTLIDPLTGNSYYAADIDLNARDIQDLDGKVLSGMKAEVILQHDHRTMGEYLLAPVSVAWSKAVRE